MNRRCRSLSAAALLTLFVLSAPAATAAQIPDRDVDVRERIVQMLKKVQKKIFGGVSSSSDYLNPPKP